jgi:hypothetical protein
VRSASTRAAAPVILCVMRRLATLALAVASTACSRDPGPEAAYRSLVKAVAERDADGAWSLLSRDSQKRLDALAREAAARAPGVVPPSGRPLLLGDAALASRPLELVEVASQEGDHAVLRVKEEGRPPREVSLVRQAGGWRVELPPR